MEKQNNLIGLGISYFNLYNNKINLVSAYYPIIKIIDNDNINFLLYEDKGKFDLSSIVNFLKSQIKFSENESKLLNIIQNNYNQSYSFKLYNDNNNITYQANLNHNHFNKNQNWLCLSCPIIITQDINNPINSTADAYLRLSALSKLIFKPNQLNLDNLFTFLPNLAWTNKGPIIPDKLEEALCFYHINNKALNVYSQDKIPPMLNYSAIENSIRIAVASRVRLGAYISPKTTIMHEGFVNFNAGTLGTCMIEGRISSGVTVNDQSDIGGGASTMGTLSGGGNVKVSIGKHSLLGANSGLGIPLGNNCTIESGLYLTASSKIYLLKDNKDKNPKIVYAKDLANLPNLLFRRNSLKGYIECLPNLKAIKLNPNLH